MFFLMFLLIGHPSLSTAELIDEKCNENGITSIIPYCIRDYGELESYVTNNKTLLRKLTETFFITGKSPSDFVKLNYNFQSLSQENSTNDTTFEDKDFYCTS